MQASLFGLCVQLRVLGPTLGLLVCACVDRASNETESAESDDATATDARAPDVEPPTEVGTDPTEPGTDPTSPNPDPSDGPDSSVAPMPGDASDHDAASNPPDAAQDPLDGSDGSHLCCPISPEPDCCMDYGGTNGDGCGTVCDGMPWPSADWQLVINADGCPQWIEPQPRSEFDCCGCISPPDGGSDGLDAALDASSQPAIDGAVVDGGAADAALAP